MNYSLESETIEQKTKINDKPVDRRDNFSTSRLRVGDSIFLATRDSKPKIEIKSLREKFSHE